MADDITSDGAPTKGNRKNHTNTFTRTFHKNKLHCTTNTPTQLYQLTITPTYINFPTTLTLQPSLTVSLQHKNSAFTNSSQHYFQRNEQIQHNPYSTSNIPVVYPTINHINDANQKHQTIDSLRALANKHVWEKALSIMSGAAWLREISLVLH